MSSHLKILSTAVVYDETLKIAVFRQGRDYIPAEKDPYGVYVRDTTKHREILSDAGLSYLPGTFYRSGEINTFNKDRLKEFDQIYVPYADSLDISIPVAMQEDMPLPLSLQMPSICMLANASPYFYKNKLYAHPMYAYTTQRYYLEAFHIVSGVCHGVHFVHKSKGIVRLAVNPSENGKNYILQIEPKYTILNQ